MGDGHEVVIAGWYPQDDVGEGEIGEQLQVADEHVQPVDIGLTAAALGEDEITEGRHRPSVVRASQLAAARRRGENEKPRRTAASGTGRRESFT